MFGGPRLESIIHNNRIVLVGDASHRKQFLAQRRQILTHLNPTALSGAFGEFHVML